MAGLPDDPGAASDGGETHVLVAVSGGSDSMALLELLALARARRSLRLTAAYVDHGVRAQAAVERAMVRASAERHGIAFVELQIERRDEAKATDETTPSESWMRERRYAVLEELATRIGTDLLATGHTYDDQIETVLFRFLRGSGRRGMAGIPQHRDRIVRPLLGTRRERLRSFLRERGVAWLEDHTNNDLGYTRNRLRHSVIPAIERELGVGALDHLPQAAQRWRVEEDHLATEAGRWTGFCSRAAGPGESPTLDLVALDEAPAAIRARVLREWLGHAAGGRSISMAQLAALEAIAGHGHGAADGSREGTKVAEIAGVTVRREYDSLRADADPPAGTRPEPAGHVAPPESFRLDVDVARRSTFHAPSGTWQITVDPTPHGPARIAASPCRQELDLDAAGLGWPLHLRPLAPGDTIRTASGAESSIRDIMVDLHVPQRVRDDWPVLATQDQVIWVPGIALSGEIGVSTRTRQAVRLAWQRASL